MAIDRLRTVIKHYHHHAHLHRVISKKTSITNMTIDKCMNEHEYWTILNTPIHMSNQFRFCFCFSLFCCVRWYDKWEYQIFFFFNEYKAYVSIYCIWNSGSSFVLRKRWRFLASGEKTQFQKMQKKNKNRENISAYTNTYNARNVTWAWNFIWIYVSDCVSGFSHPIGLLVTTRFCKIKKKKIEKK